MNRTHHQQVPAERLPRRQTDQTTVTATMTSGITFFELPAEVRNTIYYLHLIHDDVVNLVTTVREVHGGYEYKLYCNRVSGTSEAAALLKCSRQVHTEAVPVLYGNTTFSCYNEDALKAFLWRLGGQRAHLRRLQVKLIGSATVMRQCLDMLKSAKHLTALDIDYHTLYSVVSGQEVVELFLPWVKTLQTAHTSRGEEGRAVDVLEIGHVYQRPGYYGRELDEKEEQRVSRLKAGLVERLH